MKQITINRTANALQVAAAIFLLGNSFIAPASSSKQAPVNKVINNVKQNDEKKTKLNSYDVMASYIYEVASERSNQPCYLYPAISTIASGTVEPVHIILPLPAKKTNR